METQQKLIENPEEIVLNQHGRVNEILGSPPGSILHFGPTLVLGLVAILLLMGWFIKYPDVVSAEVSVVTENPPIRVVSPTSAKVRELLVADGELVKKGQPLALLDNTAVWEDVKRFKTLLLRLEDMENGIAPMELEVPGGLRLGPLQDGYAALVQKLKDFRLFEDQAGPAAKISTLQGQMERIRGLNAELDVQRKTLGQEVGIAEKNFHRNKDLNAQGIVSDVELEKIEAHYLQYKRQLESLASEAISNDIRIKELETQIIDIQQARSDGRNNRTLSLEEDLRRLHTAVSEWKKSYVLVAPIPGRVALANIWSEQQFVRVDEEVMAIVPVTGQGQILGRASLPVANSGKVAVGQRVNLQLTGFPAQEFGVVKTKVSRISLIPEAEHYNLELALPAELVTTHGVEVPFRQEMSGVAYIVTEDRRILERVFDKLFGALRNL